MVGECKRVSGIELSGGMGERQRALEVEVEVEVEVEGEM